MLLRVRSYELNIKTILFFQVPLIEGLEKTIAYFREELLQSVKGKNKVKSIPDRTDDFNPG